MTEVLVSSDVVVKAPPDEFPPLEITTGEWCTGRWVGTNSLYLGPVPLAHRPSMSTFSNTSAAHLWRHQHYGHETDPGQEKKSEHERLRAVRQGSLANECIRDTGGADARQTTGRGSCPDCPMGPSPAPEPPAPLRNP